MKRRCHCRMTGLLDGVPCLAARVAIAIMANAARRDVQGGPVPGLVSFALVVRALAALLLCDTIFALLRGGPEREIRSFSRARGSPCCARPPARHTRPHPKTESRSPLACLPACLQLQSHEKRERSHGEQSGSSSGEYAQQRSQCGDKVPQQRVHQRQSEQQQQQRQRQ